MQSGETFTDVGAGGGKFNDNRKSFGKGDVRCIGNAFAVTGRKRAAFAICIRIAADADAYDSSRSAHRVENVDVSVNDAGNLCPKLYRASGVGREPSAVGVGGGGRCHQSGEGR